MTIHEFIPFWQAQPFRPFRMHTIRGARAVAFPLQLALTPTLRVAVVIDGQRVETFHLDEISRCEPTAEPVDLPALLGAVPPELLSRTTTLLTAATSDPAAELAALATRDAANDPGRVTFLTATEKATGIFLVYAVVTTADGTRKMFSNVGTRWNVHGLEPFENGTSIYLHHLDHPTVEQRVILWPPDRATFDSFAEATSPDDLLEELRCRDAALTAAPAPPVEPTRAYLRKIRPQYRLPPRLTRAAALGAEAAELAPDRYAFDLAPLDLGDGRTVRNPVLTDRRHDRVLFDLRHTAWEAEGTRVGRHWQLALRHLAYPGCEFAMHIDGDRHTARVEGDRRALPLAFIERHLCNFALYAGWEEMRAALRAGPARYGQPDVVLPLADGFRAEMWAGEMRFPLPFLQPRIVDAAGRTVFDLRMTTWAAILRASPDRPVVTLAWVSEERDLRDIAARHPVVLDLVTHRVTSAGLEGATTIGRLQALVRQVRGAKWMLEALPQWFAQGRLVPGPGPREV